MPSSVDVVAPAISVPARLDDAIGAGGAGGPSGNIAAPALAGSSAPSFSQTLAEASREEMVSPSGGSAGIGNLPVPYQNKTPAWVRRAFALSIGVLLVVIGLWVVLARQNIVAHWPSLEKAYNRVGLNIVHTGDGIDINNVRYEIVYELGATNLVVTGTIVNTTTRRMLLPHIRATALGVDGNAVMTWQIDAPKQEIGGGENVPLQSTVKAPRETVSNLKLEYIEPPHDK